MTFYVFQDCPRGQAIPAGVGVNLVTSGRSLSDPVFRKLANESAQIFKNLQKAVDNPSQGTITYSFAIFLIICIHK